MKSVSLQVAWSWDCPMCEHRYYTRGQRMNDQETMAAARAEWGDDFGEYCVAAPEEVHCHLCNEWFYVTNADDIE